VGWPGTIFWPPAGTVILDALIFSLSDKWLDAGNKADWRTGAGGNRILLPASMPDIIAEIACLCSLIKDILCISPYQCAPPPVVYACCIGPRTAPGADSIQLPDSGTVSRFCA